MSEQEIDKCISEIGDVNDFAVSVYEIIKKSKKTKDTEAENSSESQMHTSENPSLGDTVKITDELDIPWPVDDDFLFYENNENVENDPEKEETAVGGGAVVQGGNVKDISDSDIRISRSNIAAVSQRRSRDTGNLPANSGKGETGQTAKPVRTKEEEEKIKHNKTVFYTVLAVLCPVWLLALGIVAGLFGCVYFIAGLLALVSVLGMVGVVIAGTGMALFGIVYGITKLSVKPIGLYEIGLGISIAGITMLLGILLYNFTIRVMPIVFRELIKFSKYILAKLKELFFRLRRECVGE